MLNSFQPRGQTPYTLIIQSFYRQEIALLKNLRSGGEHLANPDWHFPTTIPANQAVGRAAMQIPFEGLF